MDKKKINILVIVLFTFIVIGYLSISSNDKSILQNTKKNTDKNNFISIMLETGTGTGKYELSTNNTWPTEGYTYNEKLSKCENGSKLIWNEGNGTISLSVNVSDKCDVYFDKSSSIKYWNDNFNYEVNYAFPNTSDTTYASIAELQAKYADFTTNPIYIKTTETEHQVCGYFKTTGKEFCIGPKYWVGDAQDADNGGSTIAKLKAALLTAAGISESDREKYSCSGDSGHAYCKVVAGSAQSLECDVEFDGNLYCRTELGCGMFDDGSVFCG